VIGPSPAAWSADYPGAARRFVERAYRSDGGADDAPRTRALFLPGCAGDLRPHLLRPAGSAPDGSFREGTPQELGVLGRLLGSEVVRVAEEIGGERPDGAGMGSGLALARREAYLPYARVPAETELRAALEGPRGWWARAMLHLLHRDARLPQGEIGEVHVLRLGRHWLVTTPGETAQGIGRSIERGLAELGLAHPERGDQVLALGYTNGYAGYLCPASMVLEGGYEPEAWPDYQRPGPFGTELEALLVGAALEAAMEVGPAPER
jgi:hypothetical protein